MIDWSKRKEFISRIDAVIVNKGYIKREEMLEIYESVYADTCNRIMNQCNGKNAAYHSLVNAKVKKLRGSIRDLVTIGSDGEQHYIRRWGYDATIDAYVFQCKLAKDTEQLAKATNANSYKRKQARAYANKAFIEHEAIEEHREKVERDIRIKQWWDSQPVLQFPDGTYGAHHGF
jgi:hypothetical protein